MSEAAGSPLDSIPGEASGIPVELWPTIVELVSHGQDYFLILARSDLRILHANEAFESAIATPWRHKPVYFAETVVAELAGTLPAQLGAGPGPVQLEVYHAVSCGTRPVQYIFRAHGDRWVAFGRDQSVQLEFVAQLATLVNDLEVRFDHEKERSEALRQLSEEDALTGVSNRRAFEAAYRAHLRQYREGGERFSILCIDVDRFKRVNDRFGHMVGDEVLRRVANVLALNVRDGDRVARIGGEEFVILARGADLRSAADLAERLRGAVARAPMPAPLAGLTVSIGVACVDQLAQGVEGEDQDQDLLGLADRLLYEAKRSGRNVVRC